MYTLDRKLWLTADDKVVEDGDPKAAFLLGNAGTELTDAEAKRLGLTGTKATPAPEAPTEPAPTEAGDEPEEETPAKPKRRSPRANKQRQPAANK